MQRLRAKPDAPTAPSAPDAVLRLDALVGTAVDDRYRIDRVLGRGGMGGLFAAHDVHLERDVALKLLLPRGQNPGTDEERFLREARLASRVRHPHIVEVFDVGVSNLGLPYFVMELLEGQSLSAHLAEQERLTPSEAMKLLCPVMGALAFAHARGVLHRDIKPENIFIARNAVGALVPKLLDFGVAKGLDDATLTRSGTVVGTPGFMSPEQALGDPLSARSDIWSMGVIWFLALSGRLPFEADGVTGMLLKIVHHAAPPLGTLMPGLPPRLAVNVDIALRRDASRRHPSMIDFAHLLLEAYVDAAIPCPSDPDPIGLPLWQAWQRDATARTRTVETSAVREARAQAKEKAAPSQARARKIPRSKLGLAILLLIVVAIVVTGSVRLLGTAERPEAPASNLQNEPSQAPPGPAATPPGPEHAVAPSAAAPETAGPPSPAAFDATRPKRSAPDAAGRPTSKGTPRRPPVVKQSSPRPRAKPRLAGEGALDLERNWR
jgi:serine/threonine-protein kinase